jgi:hypothetical protein
LYYDPKPRDFIVSRQKSIKRRMAEPMYVALYWDDLR